MSAAAQKKEGERKSYVIMEQLKRKNIMKRRVIKMVFG